MTYNNEIIEEIELNPTSSAPNSNSSKLKGIVSHDEFYKKYILPDKHSEEWDNLCQVF